MKVAILTWKLHNYGTALQAYALVNWFRQREIECYLIDYSLPEKSKLTKVNSITFVDFWKKVKNRIKLQYCSKINNKYLEIFSNEIKQKRIEFVYFYGRIPSEKHHSFYKDGTYFDNEYDFMIVGSDQVWNPKYFCETYFLDFVLPQKRVAYAPSMGVSVLTENEKKYLQDKLRLFSFLSVREDTSAKLLQQILPEKRLYTVLDPTLLFNGDEWCNMLGSKKTIQEKYVLVYTLSTHPWYKEKINQIKREYGIEKVIAITSDDNLFFYKEGYELNVKAGPIQFCELIYNADVIVTDSFHGVCFSTIFHKEFICMERFKQRDKLNENSRVLDLLAKLGLSNHFIGEKDTPTDENCKIGENVEAELMKLREGSYSYLEQLLEYYKSGQ